MAHKKAAGSAKNLRDSNSKYRGVKLFGGQPTTAGNIIIRQKGDKFQLGKNVYKGSDFSIHAAIDGIVHFKKKNFTKYNGRVYLQTVVEVLPVGEVHTKHTTKKVVVVANKESATVVEKKTSVKKAAVSVEKKEKTVKAEKTPVKKAAVKKAPKSE